MSSIVSQRFVQCHDRLKKEGKIRSTRQFALSLDYLPQNLGEILKGKRDCPMELLRKAIELYKMNPMYLYTGEGTMFLDDQGKGDFRVLQILTDETGDERIVHIPLAAQAGYTTDFVEEAYFEQLPSYTIPDPMFHMGTFRSFDVEGDSMEPTLYYGDKVICSYVDPNYWATSLLDNHVYVIVCRGSIVVKRITNNIQRHRHLVLTSDNDYYQAYRMNINEIKEVWMVKMLMRPFHHTQEELPHSTIQELKETIERQSLFLEQMQAKLNLNCTWDETNR